MRLKIAKDQAIVVYIESKKMNKDMLDDIYISTLLKETANNIYDITCKKNLQDLLQIPSEL